MRKPDFRVGGRIRATLASADQFYGELILTPEHQAMFVEGLLGVTVREYYITLFTGGLNILPPGNPVT
jgi:hypothetical protein